MSDMEEDSTTAGPVDEAVAELPAGDPVLDGELLRRQEQYLRLAADFDNFKRRKAQEVVDLTRYASEAAALALLPVLDNLRRAIAQADTGDESALRQGIEMVIREFDQALERLGVTPIDSLNTPFDPAVHEAIGGVESDEVEVETVIDELRRGYRLHDRVLRPALVRVAHPARATSA
jgi:molecular chaperone GrpE